MFSLEIIKLVILYTYTLSKSVFKCTGTEHFRYWRNVPGHNVLQLLSSVFLILFFFFNFYLMSWKLVTVVGCWWIG